MHPESQHFFFHACYPSVLQVCYHKDGCDPRTRLQTTGVGAVIRVTIVTSVRNGEKNLPPERVSTTQVNSRTQINNCLREAGGCAGSPFEEIKVEIPETLCKTCIVLSDEHSVMSVPNRATASETRSPYFKHS